MSAAALGLLPKIQQNNQTSSPTLHVGIAACPIQRLLRPAELDASSLGDAIHQQALFAEPKLFSKSEGVEQSIDGSVLALEQENGAKIRLGEDGSLLLSLLREPTEGSRRSSFGGFAIIEEDVLRQLAAALAFAAWLLEKIDPTHRITHVALEALIEASDYIG